MENKKVVVTGASSGIGKCVSRALLRAGFDVVMAARRLELIEAAIKEFGDTSGRAVAVSVDVTNEESVANLFAKAVEAFGRVDVLFNNAGIAYPGIPIEDFSLADWQKAVDVNLTGTFLCSREAVRVMKKQTPKGGRIINNGSVSAQSPRPDSTAYTATKFAVSGITHCLALDGRKNDIACGQIDIGNAVTEMSKGSAKGTMQANGTVAPEQMMDVEEVGRAIVFMAGLPTDANVLHMTIMPPKMPLVGRG